MPDPNPQIAPAQFRSLLWSFALDPSLIVDHLLGEEHLACFIDQEIPRTCARIFTPLIILATFLAQILSDDHSCQAARSLPPASPDTGGYCKPANACPKRSCRGWSTRPPIGSAIRSPRPGSGMAA